MEVRSTARMIIGRREEIEFLVSILRFLSPPARYLCRETFEWVDDKSRNLPKPTVADGLRNISSWMQ